MRLIKELRQSEAVDLMISIIPTLFWSASRCAGPLPAEVPHIHVDEYQDTKSCPIPVGQTLASRFKNICVVGGCGPNLFMAGGADMQNILDFEKDYKEAVVLLELSLDQEIL